LKLELTMTIEAVDLVIIGAGPAGLAAAAEAARHKANVIVVDESPIAGGRLPSQIHPEPGKAGGGKRRWSNGQQIAEDLVLEAKKSGARIFCGASVWGIFPGWYVGVAPTNPNPEKKTFPIGFETKAVLIATGATQNPLILPGWTLPGVITAGAAQKMINVDRILPGRRATVIGIDPLSQSIAQLMVMAGVEVQGVFLPPANGLQFGPSSPRTAIERLANLSAYAPTAGWSALAKISKYLSGTAARFFPAKGINVEGVPLRLRQTVLAVDGRERAETVHFATVQSNGDLEIENETQLTTDVVITAAGLSPLVELAQIAGIPLCYIPELGGWVPLNNDVFETPVAGLFVAGSITGVEGALVAEAQGRVAGLAAANFLKLAAKLDLENDLKAKKEAVIKARKEAIPFYPNIEVGRNQMIRCWDSRSSKYPI
jgi:sarcosine oxidase subunit alpha